MNKLAIVFLGLLAFFCLALAQEELKSNDVQVQAVQDLPSENSENSENSGADDLAFLDEFLDGELEGQESSSESSVPVFLEEETQVEGTPELSEESSMQAAMIDAGIAQSEASAFDAESFLEEEDEGMEDHESSQESSAPVFLEEDDLNNAIELDDEEPLLSHESSENSAADNIDDSLIGDNEGDIANLIQVSENSEASEPALLGEAYDDDDDEEAFVDIDESENSEASEPALLEEEEEPMFMEEQESSEASLPEEF